MSDMSENYNKTVKRHIKAKSNSKVYTHCEGLYAGSYINKEVLVFKGISGCGFCGVSLERNYKFGSSWDLQIASVKELSNCHTVTCKYRNDCVFTCKKCKKITCKCGTVTERDHLSTILKKIE